MWCYTYDMSGKNKNSYSFDLHFDGQLVENSADAFDVANTIIALSTAIQQIVRIKYGDDASKQVSLNINAFKEGSLKTQFLMLLNDDATRQQLIDAAQMYAVPVFTIGKETLSVLSDFISVRTWLKGKKPKRVVPDMLGNTYTIYASDNSTVTINSDSFKALQDKTISRNIAKAVEPLEKEGSELESLSVDANGVNPIHVNRGEAKYIRNGEDELQQIDSMHLKGTVTKVDTKVRSGYVNLGSTGKKRVSFTYPSTLSQDEFDILVTSLRTGVQVYLIGSVDMDMEGLPRAIDIASVEEDEKLL